MNIYLNHILKIPFSGEPIQFDIMGTTVMKDQTSSVPTIPMQRIILTELIQIQTTAQLQEQ